MNFIVKFQQKKRKLVLRNSTVSMRHYILLQTLKYRYSLNSQKTFTKFYWNNPPNLQYLLFFYLIFFPLYKDIKQ